MYDTSAIAINKLGDMVINASINYGPIRSYLYSAAKDSLTELTGLPRGAGMVASALNDKGEVVGNGFLYNKGSLQLLTSLLPPNSGWSNLNATGINNNGLIVGQGTYNGQQLAFLMTPDGHQVVPEPSTLAIWGALAASLGLGFIKRRRGR